jgi:hypothetical protein
MEIPDFVQPPNVQSQSSTTIQPGAGGGSALNSSTPFGNTTNTNQVRTRADRETDLIKLIEDTIRPEIWRDNGGTASIRMFNGHLIVTAPRSVHEKLGGRVD